MIVQVFVPVGTGDSSLRSLLDSLADHFRDYQQDGVSFWEPSIRVVGQDPEGPWFQGNVSVPIMRDRIV